MEEEEGGIWHGDFGLARYAWRHSSFSYVGIQGEVQRVLKHGSHDGVWTAITNWMNYARGLWLSVLSQTLREYFSASEVSPKGTGGSSQTERRQPDWFSQQQRKPRTLLLPHTFLPELSSSHSFIFFPLPWLSRALTVFVSLLTRGVEENPETRKGCVLGC